MTAQEERWTGGGRGRKMSECLCMGGREEVGGGGRVGGKGGREREGWGCGVRGYRVLMG